MYIACIFLLLYLIFSYSLQLLFNGYDTIIVVLRSYFAGLRDQLIEHKVAAERAADPEDDGHAHFHGHEKCTAGELILYLYVKKVLECEIVFWCI